MKMKSRFTFARLLIAAGFVSALSGCSFLQIGQSDYSCKGMPDGVTCMSARDVYQLTENENFRQVVEQRQAAKDEAIKEGKTIEEVMPAVSPHIAAGERYVVPKPARDPIPIRSQATVMRIWVAPWESDKGDLNVPGYMYTEIEPRRWEIGTPAPKPTASIRPLESRKAVPPTAQN